MRWELLVTAICCSAVLTGNAPSAVSGASPASCDSLKAPSPQMIRISALKDSWQIQRSCDFPRADRVGFVVGLFYERWVDKFGDPDKKVFKTLNSLMIEWGEKKKSILGGAYDMKGTEIKGYAKGITLMPGYIWVWEEKYQRIAATALVHELVHSALWSSSGYHGDPDHEGGEFLGWTREHTKFIQEINSLLAELDI